MAISKVFSIRNFAIKQLMKTGDDGIMKMPSNMKADFAEAMLTKQLIDAGIDPRTIKNEQQMINVLDGIDNMKKQMAEMAIKDQTGITSAKVFDLKGKRIKDTDNIMGGEEMPPPGSRGGKDDIAAPVQSSEETIKNMIEAENKKNIAKIKNRKMIEEAIDNVSIGFSGDRRTDAELVAAEIAERRGLNVDDLDTRQRAAIYGEAYEALTDFLRKDKADGGRIGLFKGAQADASAGKGSMSPGTDTKGNVRDDNPFTGGGGGGPKGPPSVINKPPVTTKSDDPVDRGFLSDLRAKNKKKYLEILNKYKPDDFRTRSLIDGTSNLTEEEQNFIDQYGIGKIFSDLSKQNIENFMDIRKGVAPKIDKIDVDSPRQYDFAELTPKQQKFIDSKKFGLQENLLDAKDVFETITNPDKGIFDKGTFGFGAQEPTTPKEFNDYLKSIGVVQQVKDGGRIGFKKGMDRRTFMKIMAGLATLPVVGKFFKGAKVASKAAPVAMESATRSEAPTYFLKLVDKITKQGKPTTSTEDIMETYIYTAKNGDTYELVNDLKTGDLRITKDKTGIGTYGDKSFDTIEDRTIMEYKAPRQDVDVETGKGTREAAEYEEYKVEFDADGTEADATVIDEFVQKEIIEESAEEAPSIKKADGGRVGLLSGGGILRTIISNLAKSRNVKPSEYLKLTNYKALPNEAKRIISKEDFLKLKSDMTEKRIEMMENIRDMIESRQGFEKSKAELAAGMNKAAPGYGDKAVEMMFPPGSFKSPVPAGSGQKDVMMMEQLIKNLKTKDRQLNASGGVAYMLGE